VARQQRKIEGDGAERRRRARDARAKGKLPSEVGVTLGASKQRKEASDGASHQERIDQKRQGKRTPGTSGKPRPGNREIDPKRTERWE
jgi:hypothetical protein